MAPAVPVMPISPTPLMPSGFTCGSCSSTRITSIEGTSAFTGRIGERVATEQCTVVDDGTLANRRGSLNVDDEGTPTQCNTLIEKGVLKGYMHDKMNARLMKV